MLLSLVAAVVMTADPSAAGLAPRFVQVQTAQPGEQPTYQGWTKAQLEAELQRLDELRPSIAGAVTLLASGAALAAGDFVVFFFAGLVATASNRRIDTGLIIGMAVVGVIAVGLLIIGGIFLKRTSGDRSEIGRKMDLVKEAIEHLTPAPIEPTPDRPPSMPAPQQPYPQVMAPVPMIAVTLARF